MIHYYLQKNPPSMMEILNSESIEKYFYFASMELEIEEEKKRLEAMSV